MIGADRHEPEHDAVKDDIPPRDPLLTRLRPVLLFFLLVLTPVAIQLFMSYLHVYRIIPLGTTVIEISATPRASSWLSFHPSMQRYSPSSFGRSPNTHSAFVLIVVIFNLLVIK